MTRVIGTVTPRLPCPDGLEVLMVPGPIVRVSDRLWCSGRRSRTVPMSSDPDLLEILNQSLDKGVNQ